jgi:hypothetical protein
MRGWPLLLTVLLSAASVHAEQTLPVPPIPPTEQPSQDAPVPDLDVRPPQETARQSPVTLDMDIHHHPGPDSPPVDPDVFRYRTDIYHRLLAIPGIMVHLPFP